MAHKIVSKYILYPLFQLKDRNLGVLRRLHEVKRAYSLSPEKIETFRVEKLRKLLQHACNNCEYYKSLFNRYSFDPSRAGFESLSFLPILTKANIREYRQQLIATNLRSKLRKDSTGGSTAEPMVFFRDPDCWDIRNAYQIFLNHLLGWDIGTKHALIWGASRDLMRQKNMKSTIREKHVYRRIQLNAVHMSPSSMDKFTKEFFSFKPEIVYGYPSAIYHFCRYLERRSFDVDFVKSVICTAEPLNPGHARVISRVLRCEVFNRYTTRECGILAQECRAHSGLHVNYLSVEIQVRDHKIIVTDLENFGMPLINYEIGDMTPDTYLSHKRCDCGFPGPMITLGASRDTDYFKMRDGTLVFGAGIPITELTGHKGIRNIQIVQKDYDRFVVNIVKDADFTDENVRRIQKSLSKYLGQDIQIVFNYLDRIERKKSSGKYMYVISEIS